MPHSLPRIHLRHATLQDRPAIYHWLAETDTTLLMLGLPHFPDNAVPTRQEFEEDYNAQFFNDDNPDSGRSFIIELNGQGIGHINYNEINRTTATVELDIWLAGSAFCGKGYGGEAINLLCNYLHSKLRIKYAILAPSARNVFAMTAYARCGFRTVPAPEGFLPDYEDTVVMMRELTETSPG